MNRAFSNCKIGCRIYECFGYCAQHSARAVKLGICNKASVTIGRDLNKRTADQPAFIVRMDGSAVEYGAIAE